MPRRCWTKLPHFSNASKKEGLFSALEKGIFADIKRPMNGGKGLEGVSSKGRNYYNPFVEIMKNGSRAAAKK